MSWFSKCEHCDGTGEWYAGYDMGDILCPFCESRPGWKTVLAIVVVGIVVWFMF